MGPVTGMSAWYSGTERSHQAAFRRLVRPGDVVIDIGANWGLHAIYLSQLVGPEGFVIALEPYPLAFGELKWHLQANQCLNTKPMLLAIGDLDGEDAFVPSESPSQGALRSVSRAPQGANAIRVEVKTLDALAALLHLERLALVKIDVEGAEGKILAGARKVIQTFQPHFVIDLHTPEQASSVTGTLARCGYRFSQLDKSGGALLASPMKRR